MSVLWRIFTQYISSIVKVASSHLLEGVERGRQTTPHPAVLTKCWTKQDKGFIDTLSLPFTRGHISCPLFAILRKRPRSHNAVHWRSRHIYYHTNEAPSRLYLSRSVRTVSHYSGWFVIHSRRPCCLATSLGVCTLRRATGCLILLIDWTKSTGFLWKCGITC